jgi:hypothetical protein
MILYVNGCSHSDDIWQKEDKEVNGSFVWAYQLLKNFTNNFDYYRIIGDGFNVRPFIMNNSEPEVKINKSLRITTDTLINDSVSGSGNDRIFHTTLESLTKLIESGNKPDLVVLQWTGVNRRESCDIDGNPFYITPHDNIDYHLKFEPMGTTHTLHYMFILQEFLKKNYIDYRFFTYMGVDKIAKILSVYKKIDFNRFVDFGNDTIFNGLIELIKENGYNRDEQGHPNEKGAKFISDKIYQHILNLQ